MIRERTADDDEAIKRLNDAAFGGAYESRLVENLRAAGLAAVELVSNEQSVIGHILFSMLDVTVDGAAVCALALAPMSVQPQRQRGGIGSALVRAGLEQACAQGWQAVIVLGHRDYYPRFGFSAALASPLKAPFSGPSFMALELQPGALRGSAGRVVYPPAFV
ncbi:MAG: N-acetyltransferase, partial [Reyranella sp.]|nr:N-acetyltransferase [Reyranella sp.]MBL6652531.1 N-acetyltransferase [Reyranella sp.]